MCGLDVGSSRADTNKASQALMGIHCVIMNSDGWMHLDVRADLC